MIGRFLEEKQIPNWVIHWRVVRSTTEMANLYTESNQIKSIRVNTLKPDHEIQVLAGDRVPADCIVTQGLYVDVSHITENPNPSKLKKAKIFLVDL